MFKLMEHTVLDIKKRLANVINNKEIVFERLQCFELDSNSYITKQFKTLLTNIYSLEIFFAKNSGCKSNDAINVYEITIILIYIIK